MNYNGIIVIDKPAQWTSHDVVAKLRAFFIHKCGAPRKLRVGHGGTLDPMATGVLPVFTGRATRAAQFIENAGKEYIAGIKFGIVTDTQDITGTVISQSDAVTAYQSRRAVEDELKKVLPQFTGQIRQVPPMYSAIKQNGKKLYELARRGIETDRPARDIEIFSIQLLNEPEVADLQPGAIAKRAASSAANQSILPDIYLRITCSKGTYIRTLCHDIGAALGCGAAMSYLRRTRAGVFTIDMAHTLDDVINAPVEEDSVPARFILPVDTLFSKYPSVTLCDADTRKVKNGALLQISNIADGQYRFYSASEEFLLLGSIVNGKLKAIKTFFEV